jgi:hypothetical protein
MSSSNLTRLATQSADLRFAIGALLAVGVVVIFVFCLHSS